MGYSANSEIKQAMERAHASRSQALFSGVSWLFGLCRAATAGKRLGKAAGLA